MYVKDLSKSEDARYFWTGIKRFGGTSDDQGKSIVIDRDNNIIVVGYVEGDSDFDGDGDLLDGGAEDSTGYGNMDVFISKFDSSGVWQWSKRLGEVNADNAYDVAVDADNNIVVVGSVTGAVDLNGDGDAIDGSTETIGYGASDVFLSKFNSAGIWQWSKRLGGANGDVAYGLAIDTDNRIIVTGHVIGDADLNGDGDSIDGGAEDSTGYGDKDIFISKFDSSGVWQWSKRLGGVVPDYGYGVAIDTDNNIIVAGFVTGAADLNGDGDAVDGSVETTGNGFDAFISKFDSSGVWQWSKRLGGSGADVAYDIIVDRNNNIIVTGVVTGAADLNGDGDTADGSVETTGYGSFDVFISKFDSSGVCQWSKRLGGSSNDNGNSIALDMNGNIIAVGNVTGAADLNGNGDALDGAIETTGHGSNDIFISKFDSLGVWQYSKRLGGSGNDSGECVAVNGNDNVFVSGYFEGAVDLDGDGEQDISSFSGSEDIFLGAF